ncbi:hypothetical protein EPYR_03855 [Erwinia pyrifoliae DSM 12163]|nr:hypothetical protein EJP617_10620 [Erwinia sp. Ejp617]CAY76235.1 hypothetical protein EPYR_03855 [Erwinia pyrifoliae DSM 12163]
MAAGKQGISVQAVDESPLPWLHPGPAPQSAPCVSPSFTGKIYSACARIR